MNPNWVFISNYLDQNGGSILKIKKSIIFQKIQF